MNWLSKLVDKASDFFAHRKGFLPLVGILMIILNFFMVVCRQVTSQAPKLPPQ